MAEENINTPNELGESSFVENNKNEEPVESNTTNNKKKGNLNLLLTIINIALFIGLIVLYFIVLKPGNAMPVKAIQKASSGSVSIAYINSDTILTHYGLVKQMRDELEQKTIRYENELSNLQKSFEKDAAYLQEQVNKGSISEASAQEVYASLMTEQQKLMQLRERYSTELAKEEYDMNQLLLDSLQNFLDRYNKNMNFDYIFSYNRGGSILTGNDSLNITDEVLKLLNEEFEKNK
jgi:outer membrane protein